MENKPIKEHVPEKIYESEIYALIKKTEMIIVVNMQLHIKNDNGIWQVVSDLVACLRIRDMFEDEEWQLHLNTAMVGRIIQSLKTDPQLQREKTEFQHEMLLKVSNGIWDIEQSKIFQDTRDILFTREVPAMLYEKLPEESQVFQQFCTDVFDREVWEEKKQVLYEIIGFCISDITMVKVAIFLIGPANCGKSVILRFIQRLVGEENCSNVCISNFGQKYNIAEMYGKSLNISGEVPSSMLSSRALDIFKNITGGDRIELERKGRQPFHAIVDTKLLFAGNMLPSFSKTDGTNSLVERLHILKFDNEVLEQKRDSELEEKLWNERHSIVRYSLEAVREFLERGKKFITMDDEHMVLEALKQMANPIEHFIETYMEVGEGYCVHISEAYEVYRKFAEEEALPDIDRTTFRNLMSGRKGVVVGKTKKRLNGRTPKVCFEGIKIKNNSKLYDKGQDTEM